MPKSILPHLTPEIAAMFFSKVATGTEDECWLWKNKPSGTGYGRLNIRGVNLLAHRVSYVIATGTDPGDQLVCHNCPGGDNPLCVNPRHLWLGTNDQNIADRDAKGRAARGERSGHRTVPGCGPRGDRNGSRLHPQTRPRGERHGRSKLTVADVIEIRYVEAPSGIAKIIIAERHGVSDAVIGNIIRRKIWRHVL